MSAHNGNGKRPPLMAAFEAPYWVDLPLEMIEHGCSSLFEEHWQVTFAVIRCSLCYPHQQPYAVRPRLRSAGFQGWLEAFHARVGKQRPIKAGDLNEELADTDDAGKVIPASIEDIAAITQKTANNARRGLTKARKLGLVKPGFPLYPDPKPSVVPPKQKKLNLEFVRIAGIKLNLEFLPADPKLKVRALEWVQELSREFKKADQAVNAEFRKRLREGAGEFSILIPKRGRVKSKESVRPSLPVMEEQRSIEATNGRTELIPLIVEELRHIGEVFPKWSRIDNPGAAAKSIAEACDYDKDMVTAVFQNFAASVRESDANIKSAVGLLIARARRFQQGRSVAAGAA